MKIPELKAAYAPILLLYVAITTMLILLTGILICFLATVRWYHFARQEISEDSTNLQVAELFLTKETLPFWFSGLYRAWIFFALQHPKHTQWTFGDTPEM